MVRKALNRVPGELTCVIVAMQRSGTQTSPLRLANSVDCFTVSRLNHSVGSTPQCRPSHSVDCLGCVTQRRLPRRFD